MRKNKKLFVFLAFFSIFFIGCASVVNAPISSSIPKSAFLVKNATTNNTIIYYKEIYSIPKDVLPFLNLNNRVRISQLPPEAYLAIIREMLKLYPESLKSFVAVRTNNVTIFRELYIRGVNLNSNDINSIINVCSNLEIFVISP